jgi:hypothetical protein
MTGDEFTEQRAHLASGDHAWFVRKMISLAAPNMEIPEAMQEIFDSTVIRTRHSDNFSKTFKKLLEAARAVDTDDMLVDALLNGSAPGLFYRIILHARGDTSMDPILGTNTPTIHLGPVSKP